MYLASINNIVEFIILPYTFHLYGHFSGTCLTAYFYLITASLLGLVLLVLFCGCLFQKLNGAVKKRLETMSWPSRFLFLLMGLTISIILTAHSILKQITSPIVKPVTKQELRTFLESISPLILDQIDTKEKVIGVWLGNRGEDKLLDLSERPGFDNLISIKRGNKGWIMPSCIERG